MPTNRSEHTKHKTSPQVDKQGLLWLGDVCVCLVGKDPSGSAKGITGWVVEGLPAGGDTVHGIRTAAPLVTSSTRKNANPHPNSVVKIDHVVISSPNLARTEAEMRNKLGVCGETRELTTPDSFECSHD